MDVLTRLVDDLGAAGMTLRKAQPRGLARLTMELETSEGVVCAGQWHDDVAEAARVATLVRGRFGHDAAEVLGAGRIVVQRAGADRRLPVLSRLLLHEDATLVAHRPERRAVVRLGADRYAKVVRSGRTQGVVAPLRLLHLDGVRLPEVVSVNDRRGVVTVSAVPGRTMLEQTRDPAVPDDGLAAQVAGVGAAVRRLHEHAGGLHRSEHDGAAELAAAQRWLVAAHEHQLLPDHRWRRALEAVAARIPDPPRRPSLLHRDLHDKQVVLSPGADVGLLDLDLVARGDPAVDLANLLAHVDLRVRQGLCSPARGERLGAALLDGYAPGTDVVDRLGPYVALTRLRLAGVYSFRPSPPGLVDDLLASATPDRSTLTGGGY